MSLEGFHTNAKTMQAWLAQLLRILFRIQKELKNIISKNSYLQRQSTVVNTFKMKLQETSWHA